MLEQNRDGGINDNLPVRSKRTRESASARALDDAADPLALPPGELEHWRDTTAREFLDCLEASDQHLSLELPWLIRVKLTSFALSLVLLAGMIITSQLGPYWEQHTHLGGLFTGLAVSASLAIWSGVKHSRLITIHYGLLNSLPSAAETDAGCARVLSNLEAKTALRLMSPDMLRVALRHAQAEGFDDLFTVGRRRRLAELLLTKFCNADLELEILAALSQWGSEESLAAVRKFLHGTPGRPFYSSPLVRTVATECLELLEERAARMHDQNSLARPCMETNMQSQLLRPGTSTTEAAEMLRAEADGG